MSGLGRRREMGTASWTSPGKNGVRIQTAWCALNNAAVHRVPCCLFSGVEVGRARLSGTNGIVPIDSFGNLPCGGCPSVSPRKIQWRQHSPKVVCPSEALLWVWELLKQYQNAPTCEWQPVATDGNGKGLGTTGPSNCLALLPTKSLDFGGVI